MYYETETNDHGLPHNPFKSCVIPRPIAWITSCNEQGVVNLAPYSYFNAIADSPPMLMFSATRRMNGEPKDTLHNVEQTKEFVVNMATWDLRNEVNLSSAEFAPEISEIDITNLKTLPSRRVKPPRIAQSPIHFECVLHQTILLPATNPQLQNCLVLGRVIGIHIDDAIIKDGKVDVSSFKPIARLGYMEYTTVDNIFVMQRPL
jgi:flavin reductase (DIM6/NTAB) family NADH-FMN oxidoreductase RutF